MDTTTAAHAIPRFAHAVDAALDKVLTSSPVFMSAPEKADALVTLAKIESRITAMRMRVLATAEDVGQDAAFRSVTDYLAHQLRTDRGPISRERDLAVDLDRRWSHVEAALAAGALTPAKARLITVTLNDLDTDPEVPTPIVDSAEQQLVADGAEFNLKALRRLAERVLDVVAPHINQAREAKRLAAAEARALRSSMLSFHQAPHGLVGVTEIRARVPTAVAARLRTYLDAFTAPRHLAMVENPLGDYVPYKERLAHAFTSLLERLDPHQLPVHGGTATTVIVTISYQDLKPSSPPG